MYMISLWWKINTQKAVTSLNGPTDDRTFNSKSLIVGFPGSSAGKESACNAGDLGLIPGLRRFPGEGKGYPLQYSGLENSMDRIVHGIAKSQTRLSDFHSLSLSATQEIHIPGMGRFHMPGSN